MAYGYGSIRSAVSIAGNVTGVNDILKAVNYYRNGQIEESKQAGYKAAIRLIGVATLITGVYWAQTQYTRKTYEAQLKKCFRENFSSDPYYEEKGFFNKLPEILEHSTSQEEFTNTAAYWIHRLTGSPLKNMGPIILDLNAGYQKCVRWFSINLNLKIIAFKFYHLGNNNRFKNIPSDKRNNTE